MAQNQMNVKVGVDNTPLQSGLTKSKSLLMGFAAGVGAGIAGMVGGAMRQVGAFIKDSVQGAAEELDAQNRLLVALGGRVNAQQKLLEQANQLSKTTLFADDQIIAAQASLAYFVKDEEQIKKLIPAVMDLAQAKGIDLKQAADMVGKSVGSSTNALAKSGIAIEGAAGSAERADMAVQGLAKAFGGQAEAAALAGGGPLKMLSKAWGEIKDDVGMALLPILNRVANWFRSILPRLSDGFQSMKAGIVGVINYFITLYNESLLVRGVVQLVVTAFKVGFEAIRLAIASVVNNVKMLGEIIGAVLTGKFSKIGDIIAESQKRQAAAVVRAGENIGEAVADGIENTISNRQLIKVGAEQKSQAFAAGEELGADLADGIAKGVADNSEDVVKVEGLKMGAMGGLPAGEIAKSNTELGAMEERITGLNQSIPTFGENLRKATEEAIRQELAVGALNGVTELLNQLSDTANMSQKERAEVMRQTTHKIIKGLIAEGVAAIIRNILAGPTGATLGPFALAVAAAGGAGASALFSAMIPKFAMGGIVPAGFPSDSYPALLSSGEEVIPAPIRRRNEGSGLQIRGVAYGRDMRLINERQSYIYGRTN